MDWRSFLKENVRTEKVFHFNPETHEKYSQIYERYKYLYNILADYWEVIE
jgi:sugar (pentulose or hexulose) kinase